MESKRDERFSDIFNDSVIIDGFYGGPGPIIYKTNGKPWEYYVDMNRQLWYEARA